MPLSEAEKIRRIRAYFDKRGAWAYSFRELQRLLESDGINLGLPKSLRIGDFLNFAKEGGLKEVALELPIRTFTRYVWGVVPILPIVQSIDRRGYFTHYTAMHLHQLTEQLPKQIYFNREQRSAGGGDDLSQASITRAFKNKCRITNNRTIYDGVEIVGLNGKNTGRTAVMEGFDVLPFSLTNLERTLIDATVRPIYSGGVSEVAKAFKKARNTLSVNKMLGILKRLDFMYPYHQSIGYYLERGGYSNDQLELVRKLPREFDFYLDYAMRQTDYSGEWRLHIPKGF